MRKRKVTVVVKSIGLPCITTKYHGKQFLKLMREFYSNPENEAAFQRWLKKRRKEK